MTMVHFLTLPLHFPSLSFTFLHFSDLLLVWRHDENYGWEYLGADKVLRGKLSGGRGWTGHILNMTSQRWLTDADFAESSDAGSIWWHWVVVIVPDEIKFTRNASMWITGGGMSSNPPTADSEDILVSAALACSVGTVTTVLFQVIY